MYSANRRIRDPLHNLIEFNDELFERTLWDLLQTRPFQRLRRIKQLGFSDLVYPGATHTRFMHSLGAFHIARRLLARIRELMPKDFNQRNAESALAAALLHDLGHGPFSHAFETAAEHLKISHAAKHEMMTVALIRKSEIAEILDNVQKGFTEQVAGILEPGMEKSDIYSAVVSSQFDADRLDYMQRDRFSTGTHLGTVDCEWLLSNMEIGTERIFVDEVEVPESKATTLVINSKGVLAAESYVLNLFHLYPVVYFHKTTRGAEKLFFQLLTRFFFLLQEGGKNLVKQSGLPARHPLFRFAREASARRKEPPVEEMIALDDTTMWGAFEQMGDAKDPLISDFSRRLSHRRLFKCIDVRERLKSGTASPSSGKETSAALDNICEDLQEKINLWNQNNGQDPQKIILTDKVSRKTYKEASDKKGLNEHIRVKTGDTIRSIDEVSSVVGAMQPFVAFRCYVASRECEAYHYVEMLLQDALKALKRG